MLGEDTRKYRTFLGSMIYLLIVSIVVTLYYGDMLPILFIGITFILVYKKRYYAGLLCLTALSLYISGKDLYSLLSTIPFILVFPINVKSIVKPIIKPTGFFGPLARSIITISSIYLPVIFLRPIVSLYYIVMYVYIITLVTVNYSRLRNISYKVVYAPKTIALTGKSSIVILIESTVNAFIHVVSGGEVIADQIVQGVVRLEIPLHARRLGVMPYRFRIYAVDPEGFTSRLVGVIEGEVNVAPYTKIAIEKIRTVLKEILVEAGFPMEIKVYTIKGVFGGGYGEGESEISEKSLEEGYLGKIVARILAKERGSLLGARKYRRGEYMGAREFSSGDSPRDIHWKKTISKLKLYVKEYSGHSGGGGGNRILVITDLLSSNSRELDTITYTTLSFIVGMLARNVNAELSLVVIAPSNEILYVRGSPLQILAFFTRVYEEGLVKLFYEYESFGREYGPDDIYKLLTFKDKSLIIETIRQYSIMFSKKLLRMFSEKKLLPPLLFTIIHGNPSALHNSVLKELLVMNGYTYIPPRVMPYSELTRVITEIAAG